MRFLRPVANYRLMDTKRNTGIREELKVYPLNTKFKDYRIAQKESLDNIKSTKILKKIYGTN